MEAVSGVAAASRPSVISRLGDWWIPLSAGTALAIVTALPYVYGYLFQPHGQVFMGFFYLGDDANTYLAKQRGERIDEVGVVWRHSAPTKVAAFRSSLDMFKDVVRTRFRKPRPLQ